MPAALRSAAHTHAARAPWARLHARSRARAVAPCSKEPRIGDTFQAALPPLPPPRAPAAQLPPLAPPTPREQALMVRRFCMHLCPHARAHTKTAMRRRRAFVPLRAPLTLPLPFLSQGTRVWPPPGVSSSPPLPGGGGGVGASGRAAAAPLPGLPTLPAGLPLNSKAPTLWPGSPDAVAARGERAALAGAATARLRAHVGAAAADGLGLRRIGAADGADWSLDEVAAFAAALTSRRGRDFRAIAARLPRKSVARCVSFYYNVWKTMLVPQAVAHYDAKAAEAAEARGAARGDEEDPDEWDAGPEGADVAPAAAAAAAVAAAAAAVAAAAAAQRAAADAEMDAAAAAASAEGAPELFTASGRAVTPPPPRVQETEWPLPKPSSPKRTRIGPGSTVAEVAAAVAAARRAARHTAPPAPAPAEQQQQQQQADGWYPLGSGAGGGGGDDDEADGGPDGSGADVDDGGEADADAHADADADGGGAVGFAPRAPHELAPAGAAADGPFAATDAWHAAALQRRAHFRAAPAGGAQAAAAAAAAAANTAATARGIGPLRGPLGGLRSKSGKSRSGQRKPKVMTPHEFAAAEAGRRATAAAAAAAARDSAASVVRRSNAGGGGAGAGAAGGGYSRAAWEAQRKQQAHAHATQQAAQAQRPSSAWAVLPPSDQHGAGAMDIDDAGGGGASGFGLGDGGADFAGGAGGSFSLVPMPPGAQHLAFARPRPLPPPRARLSARPAAARAAAVSAALAADMSDDDDGRAYYAAGDDLDDDGMGAGGDEYGGGGDDYDGGYRPRGGARAGDGANAAALARRRERDRKRRRLVAERNAAAAAAARAAGSAAGEPLVDDGNGFGWRSAAAAAADAEDAALPSDAFAAAPIAVAVKRESKPRASLVSTINSRTKVDSATAAKLLAADAPPPVSLKARAVAATVASAEIIVPAPASAVVAHAVAKAADKSKVISSNPNHRGTLVNPVTGRVYPHVPGTISNAPQMRGGVGGKFDTDTTRLLAAAFELNPFPSRATKIALAAQTGLTPEQTRVWFMNARARGVRL
jgi:hypothetical protein